MRLIATSLLIAGLSFAGRPTLDASPAHGPIVIDGQLDEPAWADCAIATGFTERTPNPGVAAAVKTEVRVLHDATALYVGVTSHLADGESPRGLEMTRDSFNVFSDDTITLKFDVHRDHRTTIGLAVNLAGAQLDYLAVGIEQRNFRGEFDAVWDAAVHVADDRWTVEYRIPYVALGLSGGDGLLGLQVTRDHPARNATYDWSAMPPEFGPVSAPHYGTLSGPRSATGGHPVSAVPYVSAETDGDRLDQTWGGDLRARLDEDVWGELSFNTDFAEVDLDAARVNLDRFQLFFPEKRPFFLRGLDVFQFGSPGAVQPFFSRTVGLGVPLWGAAKLYGRSGPVSFGVLDGVTEEPAGEAGTVLTNSFVGRARVDNRGSGVGAIVTHRSPLGDGDADPTAHYGWGVDATLLTLESRLAFETFYAGALADPPGDGDAVDGHAGQAKVQWRGDLWRPVLAARLVEPEYDPALGFAARSGMLYQAESSWILRFPDTWLWRLEPVVKANAYTPVASTDVTTFESGAGLVFGLAGGWEVEAAALYIEDEIDTPTTIAGELLVPAGRFSGAGAEFSLSTPGTLNPGASLDYELRDGYFGGTLHNIEGSARVSFGPHVRLDGSLSTALIDLPECGRADCSLTTHAVNGGLRVAATPRLFANVSGRYDTASDTVLSLARLRWRYAPGSDLFVVYRHGYDLDESSDAYRVTLKLAHRFDGLL